MRVGACRAEVGDGKPFLQRIRSGHDLPVNGPDGCGRQTSAELRVAFHQRAQHGFLTFRGKDRTAILALDLAHFMHEGGPLVEQLQELLVEGVDFFTNLRQRHGRWAGEQWGRFPRWAQLNQVPREGATPMRAPLHASLRGRRAGKVLR